MTATELDSSALLSLSLMTGAAQPDTHEGAPSLVVGMEDCVRLERMPDYLAATKEWIADCRRRRRRRRRSPKLAFNAFKTGPDRIEYLEPVAELKGWGGSRRVLNEACEEASRKSWANRRQTAIRWTRYTLWQQLPELSFRPEHPAPSPAEMPYFVWWHIRVSPQNEAQFLDTLRSLRVLIEKRRVSRGCGVFRNLIGYEGPLYAVVLSGRDPGELYRWQSELYTRIVSELKPAFDALHALTADIAEGQGWAIPELSLTLEVESSKDSR